MVGEANQSGYDLRHHVRWQERARPYTRHTILIDARQPVQARLADGRRGLEGARIPTTADLADHPVTGHVRDALARAELPTDPRRREYARALVAAEALSDYLAAPGNSHLATFIHEVLAVSGDAETTLPRWMDTEPAHSWQDWADTLRHTARVLDTAEVGLTWLSGRLRDTATVLDARTAALEHASAETPPPE
jgi:hypothetical protein